MILTSPKVKPLPARMKRQKVYSQLETEKCVIKAQVLAGGRGKGGGVKIVETMDEAKAFTSKLVGSRLITAQTGDKGIVVNRVLVAEAIDIKKELYLAISIDRSTSRITIISSTEGGTEIEEVSAKTPDKILKEQINPLLGIRNFQARQIALNLGLTGPSFNERHPACSKTCSKYSLKMIALFLR